jgi:hypothetical protein
MNVENPTLPPVPSLQSYTTPDTLGNVMCLDHGVHAMFDAETPSWAVFIPDHPFGPKVDRLEIHTLLPFRPPSLCVQKHQAVFHELPQHLPTLYEPAAQVITQFHRTLMQVETTYSNIL